MKITQLAQPIEKIAAKKAKSALDIAKELDVKPISVSETISDALKITSNNNLYFSSKTPIGNIEKNNKNIVDYFI